jgi:hypothetical protein
MSRASRRNDAAPRRDRIGNFRFSNPDCLHCVVVDLTNEWVARDRDAPTDALLRLGEAIGSLIAQMPDPEDRHAARRDLATVIHEVSERVMGNA